MAWAESDGFNEEIRVARLNAAGDAWVEVGAAADPASPINVDPSRNADEPSLIGIGGVPYVAWVEGDGTNDELRVARLDSTGGFWVQVGAATNPASPINNDPIGDARYVSLTALGGIPHVAWSENAGGSGLSQIRVARLNGAGNDWEEIVGGRDPDQLGPGQRRGVQPEPEAGRRGPARRLGGE